MKKSSIILASLLLFIFNSGISAQTTIYLVRHAEKETSKNIKDPSLTHMGKFRAENIAKQLAFVGVTHIFSTDYNRTMQTAKPLAFFEKLEIENYDPSKLKEFAEKLKTLQGNILVVGHSNTTPQLTQLLSGKEIKAIREDEFDNMYQVILLDDKVILNQFKTIPAVIGFKK